MCVCEFQKKFQVEINESIKEIEYISCGVTTSAHVMWTLTIRTHRDNERERKRERQQHDLPWKWKSTRPGGIAEGPWKAVHKGCNGNWFFGKRTS